MTETKRYLVAGEWKSGSETFEVKSPYDDSLVATVAKPTEADVEAAVAAAADSFQENAQASGSCTCRSLDAHLDSLEGTRRRDRRDDLQRGREAHEVGEGRGGSRGIDVQMGC